MTPFKNQTALITGASSGIGYELAKLFAQNGINMVLVARRKSLLEKLKQDFEQQYQVEVVCLDLDLSILGQAQALYDACKAQNLQIDYLVNNAGYGAYGPVQQADPAGYENMLSLNIITLTTLTTLFVKEMVQRRFGRILNVGSLAAFQSLPNLATYGASKTYVMHFTEGLHAELKGTGVTATVLNPGVTKTGFIERADLGRASAAQGTLLTASAVARAGYRAMMRGKLNVVPGWKNRLLAFTAGITPSRKLLLAISSVVMREAGKLKPGNKQ
ncbi:SDR family NAD(P)-dependent oxidoreductase [Hymenobacter cavernae]|uniref:Oxidoreductase n=1 Tax=Hymenobacter cavernae TaxID=2044852 RepID=A0ABQ1UC17_9BACT|nr:SDR family oxidoreductase [Hymenobacter cavernae]GGF15480.1 oxidoreductase [Hymenobacter cavernae]